MGNRNNVIDIKTRRSTHNEKQDKLTPKAVASAAVLDLTERRQAALQDERRAVRRTILTEFVGAFVLIPGYGLKKIALYDVSDKGLSFDLDFEMGQLKSGEEVAMRLYLSQFTYFPFVVTITNVREVPEEGVIRHGGNFVKETINDKALFHFVKFIENVSLELKRDNGDLQKKYQK